MEHQPPGGEHKLIPEAYSGEAFCRDIGVLK